MPETRRHHTNSVKLIKILWNELSDGASDSGELLWNNVHGVQKQPFCVALIGE